MMSKLKKFVIYMLFLAITSNGGSAFAATDNSQVSAVDSSGDVSIGRCIQKGNVDFGLFLNTFIFNDGFYDGVIEPWKDVLSRNQCHATVISGLLKQQDKIRDNIRDAFLTCTTEKLSALEKAFDSLNVEVYYVRKLVDGKLVLSLPFNLLTNYLTQMEAKESGEGIVSLFYPKERLYNDIIDKYRGKTTLNDQELELLFSKLDFKYESKKKEFVVCSNSSWEGVSEKWKEFIESAGGITPAWNEAEKEIGGAAEKLVEGVNAGALKATYQGWVQVNLNNQSAKEGFADIAKKFSEVAPGTTAPTVSQSEFLDAAASSSAAFDIANTRAEMLTNYETLYKKTKDDGSQLLVTNLAKFNKLLETSFPVLDQVLTGTKMMNKRQCP